MASERTAEQRWAEALEAWAIPPEILAQAPASPYGHDPGWFARRAQTEVAEARPTPSRRAALEALAEGGSVLDVGAGGGAASLPLLPDARALAAVDRSPAMLEAYAEQARALGHAPWRPALLYALAWPRGARVVPVADVAVCHHVVHDVAAIGPFVDALTAHARRRVVLEMRADHPLAWMNPLWERFWSVPRPHGPGPDELAAVLAERGVVARVERWESPDAVRPAAADLVAPDDDAVASATRRLCLGDERRDEVREALADTSLAPTRQLATVWWDVE